jgi:hypothetical protein
LANFKQIWIFFTNFRKSPQYQIWWRSVHWEPSWYTCTDEQLDKWTSIAKVIGTFVTLWTYLKCKEIWGALYDTCVSNSIDFSRGVNYIKAHSSLFVKRKTYVCVTRKILFI